MFKITLFTSSQYLIYAASNLYAFCKSTHTDINLEYRWEDWKNMLKESKNIENISAKNNALAVVITMNIAAVITMNMVEQYYISCQISEDK